MLRVRTAVAVGEGFQLRLRLTDGSERIVDVSPFLRGPIFDLVRTNREVFNSVAVDPVLGTVVWPNGADIDPDVLLLNRKPAAAEIDFVR
jgi:hypothetical protein